MLVFPVLRKARARPLQWAGGSSPEAWCHPPRHCQGMSSPGGLRGLPLCWFLTGGTCALGARLPCCPRPLLCRLRQATGPADEWVNAEARTCKTEPGVRKRKKGKVHFSYFVLVKKKTSNCRAAVDSKRLLSVLFASLPLPGSSTFPLFFLTQQLALGLNPCFIQGDPESGPEPVGCGSGKAWGSPGFFSW